MSPRCGRNRTTNHVGSTDSVGGPTLESDALESLVETYNMGAHSRP